MISHLTIENFTRFPSADLKFGSLNVVHGENSSGKSHLLKLAYSLISSLSPRPNAPGASDSPTKSGLAAGIGEKLSAVFRPDQGKLGRLARRVQGASRCKVRATLTGVGSLAFSFSTQSDRKVGVESVPKRWLEAAPIYIPTRELLSVYPNFVSLYETQAIPFDETWRDTCVLLGAPVSRGAKKREIAELLKPLEDAIGCKTLLEGGRFYLAMSDPNAKVEADLVAEGYRKVAMVARLIANGSLDDKGYLFWDEPEANLNARLIRQLAPLLIALARGGVQVFIATHSLFLMRELEIGLEALAKGAPDARFFGLQTSSDGARVEQGERIEESGDIAALDESLAQSERFLGLESA